MSKITNQVRESLRALGGSAPVADIAEHAGLEKTQVAPAIKALEATGEVVVNRDERPFTATLNQDAPAVAEGDKPARKKRGAKPARKATRAPRKAKAPKKARKPAPRTQRRARASAPRVERVDDANVIAIDRSAALRLAVLALNPAEPITDEDRLAIAAVIRAAA